MKGVVFTEFLTLVERRHGLPLLDEVLQSAAPANGGAYTSVGTYDWRELAALASALGDRLGGTAAEVLRDYGKHLFGVFAERFPEFFVGHASALDFLASVEDCIHPEVRKLHPEAELPSFTVRRTSRTLELQYASPRALGDFALGLVEGCLAHFGAGASLSADGAGGRWTFRIREQEAVPCPNAT